MKTKHFFTMNALRDELMSISSNSVSLNAESQVKTEEKKPTRKRQRTTKYAIEVRHVPKRSFDHIQRKLRKNKSVIELKTRSTEKTNCDRFILSQIEGSQNETISPESTTRLMLQMREGLQRKDYGNLAKLISTFTEMPVGKSRWYPTLIKYCLIALMYDPLVQGTELMDMFLSGVMGSCSTTTKKEILRDISRLPSNIHVTKYDDLWKDYPLANQMNEANLNKMCKILNNRDDIKVENTGDSSGSEWESYDENSSNDDIQETTEAEIPCDFSAALHRIEQTILK